MLSWIQNITEDLNVCVVAGITKTNLMKTQKKQFANTYKLILIDLVSCEENVFTDMNI